MQTIEANSRAYLSTYNPNQSMTLSALAYEKEFDTFGQLGMQDNENFTTVFIKLDISGWNAAFRQETCSVTAMFLDSIFGERFYEKFMMVFEQTFMTLQVIRLDHGRVKGEG